MENNYKRLSFYISNSCNIKCRYCYERGLNTVPFPIEYDYEKYINTVLSLNKKNKNTIEELELWGGEPLLKLTFFLRYFDKFLISFPNLTLLQLSTNLLPDNSVGSLLDIINIVQKFRSKFTIKLQISLDGQPDLNDFNRGNSDKIIRHFKNLLSLWPEKENFNLVINTNAIFNKSSLSLIESYKDIQNWFEFYLNNFKTEKKNINLSFSLLHPADNCNWEKEDGLRYLQVLEWMDKWRDEHPKESKKFNWIAFKENVLSLCVAGSPHAYLALSPGMDQAICHKAIWDKQYLKDKNIKGINLTDLYTLLMDQYSYYQNISLDIYKKSLPFYISINWCPYEFNYKPNWELLFLNQLPLWYNGAINIIMKWSKEYELD